VSGACEKKVRRLIMNAFERALAATLAHEGFFSNNPTDRGGATNFGISESVARNYGYIGDMKDLPVETAKDIYRQNYWDKNRLDEIAEYNEQIAVEIFDSGVNMGTGQAGEFLQRAINCLNRGQDLFPNLKVDGIIGSKTIEALKKLSKLGEKLSILKMLNALQGVKYMEICENDPSQEGFIRGWLNRVTFKRA
jgi:lysozyme family protein